MRFFSSSRTFDESLIVVVVAAGFFWLMAQGKFEVQNIWSYAGFLAMIAVFYFVLLLCHMGFFHMIGGNGTYPWWEHVDHTEKHKKRMEGLKKIGKK